MDQSGVSSDPWSYLTRRGFVRIVAGSVGAAFVTPWLGNPSASAAGPNPITVENQAVGSYGWYKVFSNQSQAGEIEGYASSPTVEPGQTLSFHLSTSPSAAYRIEIYRIGYYGGRGSRLMTTLPSASSTITGTAQLVPAVDAFGRRELSWPVSASLTIPSDWVSGYYVAVFEVVGGPNNESNNFYPFVVTAPPSRPKVALVHTGTTTWQAYNNWPGTARGGKSLYVYNSVGTPATKISFRRPYNVVGNQNVFEWEAQFAQWLERIGYDVAYTTGIDTHRDPTLPAQYGVVVVSGHDEYWSSAIRTGFESAVSSGTNMAFVGANLAYWNIRFEDGEKTIVAYKDTAPDPISDTSNKTVKFRDLVPPRPEAALIGVQFEWGMPNGFRDFVVAPAASTDPWFAGTGFVPGETVAGVVGYEYDTVVAGTSPSGLTTFFSYAGSPSEELPSGQSTRYVHPSGAIVFSTGTMEWPIKMATNPKLEIFTRNAFDALFASSGPPPPTNEAPTVSVSSPTAGTVVQVGSPVSVSASASDPDGGVARVEFLANGAVFAERTAAPYSVTWVPSAAGTVVLTARATDGPGAATVSAGVSVIVQAPPPPPVGVSLVGVGQGGNTGTTSSLVMSLPAGVAAGDLVLIAVQVAKSVTTLVTPAGYSVVRNFVPSASTHPRVVVYSRFATGGETSVTVQTGRVAKSGVVLVYRGVDRSTPVGATSAASAAGKVVTIPSLTAPSAATRLVGVFASQNHPSQGSFSAPTGMAMRAEVRNLAKLGIASADQTVGAGATGTRVVRFSASGATLSGVLVALRPQPAPEPPPNSPPSVSLTAPVAGAVVDLGTPIDVQASASDADGSVTRVEFMAGGVVFAERTAAPFVVSWTPTAVGPLVLSARAFDSAGASVTSTGVVIEVRTPPPANLLPTISLSAPASGATLVVGVPVGVSAEATDPDGVIARVEFLADGLVFAERTAAPFSVSWVPDAARAVALSARAFDNAGASAVSADVPVLVQAPPPPTGSGVTLVGVAQGGNNGSSSSIVLPMPAGTAAGDVVLVAVQVATNVTTLVHPSGYSIVHDFVPAQSWHSRLIVYSKLAVSGEASVTVQTGWVGKSAVLLVYRGLDAASPVAAVSFASKDGTTVTIPSVDSPMTGTQLLGLFASQNQSAPGVFTVNGMTERAAVSSLSWLGISAADQVVSAGMTGTRTATFSVAGGALTGVLLALRPSVG